MFAARNPEILNMDQNKVFLIICSEFLDKVFLTSPGQGSSPSFIIHNDYCRQGQGFGLPFINCKDFFAVKIHSNLFAYFDVVDPQMSEMNSFDYLQQRAIFKK